MKEKTRFWFGHFSREDKGSVVIWDRERVREADEHVELYHAKGDCIVRFHRRELRTILRPIDRAEECIVDAALSGYFALLDREDEESLREIDASFTKDCLICETGLEVYEWQICERCLDEFVDHKHARRGSKTLDNGE